MGVLPSAAALIVLVCSVKPSGVSAGVGWIHGGDICGGAHETDGTIYIGKKGSATCADDTARPAEYVKMKVEGLAALRESSSAYLTDSSKFTIIEPTSSIGPIVEAIEQDNVRYGRAVAGQIMGDAISGAYGFAGTASYLMAEGNRSFNTNEFLVPGRGGVPQTVSGICVVPLVNGQCGESRTAVPGTYKFSLYGFTGGPNFASWASAYTHIGVRQTVDFAHMGSGASVSINGNSDVTPANVGATPVASVLITGASTSLAFTFPTTYNVGSTSTGAAVPAATLNVIIHASPHPSDASKFFVDYIFTLNNGLEAANGYFVYDPDVTSGLPQQEPSTSQPEPSTSQPEPSTSQPEPSTSQPEPSTSQPEPSTSQPAPSMLNTNTARKTTASYMSIVAGLAALAFVVH